MLFKCRRVAGAHAQPLSDEDKATGVQDDWVARLGGPKSGQAIKQPLRVVKVRTDKRGAQGSTGNAASGDQPPRFGRPPHRLGVPLPGSARSSSSSGTHSTPERLFRLNHQKQRDTEGEYECPCVGAKRGGVKQGVEDG